ncbi:hypothetical protein THRCLA_04741 [Thraustotheca clavata]|uniref:BAR domain-containing protein n=1 Tax=Thraustotheca clavata TaxID=74557 RepID=A0A1V9ZY48_9STRA|nr:hypothetical protein THRCLA_04741 [Thraustotheca clavata]
MDKSLSFWRRKRILTQEVLQALGKTTPSDDCVYKQELLKFQNLINHIRSTLRELENYRSQLKAYCTACSALAGEVVCLNVPCRLNEMSLTQPETLAAALRQVDVSRMMKNQYHSVDDTIAGAIRSLGIKLADLESYSKEIKARASAKLEYDSYPRDTKDPKLQCKQQAARTRFEDATRTMLRIFAKYHVARDSFLSGELEMIRQALFDFFQHAAESMAMTFNIEKLDIAPQEENIYQELLEKSNLLAKEELNEQEIPECIAQKNTCLRRPKLPSLPECHAVVAKYARRRTSLGPPSPPKVCRTASILLAAAPLDDTTEGFFPNEFQCNNQDDEEAFCTIYLNEKDHCMPENIVERGSSQSFVPFHYHTTLTKSSTNQQRISTE